MLRAACPVADLLRKYGVSKATFLKWRSKYGGASISDRIMAVVFTEHLRHEIEGPVPEWAFLKSRWARWRRCARSN